VRCAHVIFDTQPRLRIRERSELHNSKFKIQNSKFDAAPNHWATQIDLHTVNQQATRKFDVIVVGGGMVGAALACALAPHGIRVAVIEVREPQRTWPAGETANRVSALSRASQHVLEHLGAWPRMTALGVTSYRAMYVWDAGGSGHIRFDSAEVGEPDLGHIVENRVTQLALWERLEALESVTLLCPARVRGFELSEECARVRLEDGSELQAALLVGADGRDSATRERAGIVTHGWDYDQHALVANVVHELSHEATAWQRFRPTGPLAFLPLAGGRSSSIVWSTSPQQARELLELEQSAFCAELGKAFGHRLGRVVESGPKGVFPLRLQHAERYVQQRLALVGDAAHTLHPLAGQGVNLGFMDAAALADVVLEAAVRDRDPGALHTLRRYERARKGANIAMLGAMDAFKRLFSNDAVPLRLLRNAGLDLVDRATPLKNLFLRRALGAGGELPSLARPPV
jgi:2-octaprenylphenol hydroxylase